MARHRGDHLRFVVADGDPSFAERVVGALDGPGVTGEAVTSARDAVERACDGERSVDGLIVGDELETPVDVVERVRNTAELPVVLVCEDPEDHTISAAVEAGAVDVFPRTTAAAQYRLVAETVAAKRHTAGVRSAPPESDEQSAPPESDGTDTGDTDRAYREVFESVSDGLVVHDPETGEVLDVNERFCEMNGYGREELIGETIDVVTAPDESYSYEAAHERIETASQEGPQLFEWRNQRKDGETFPVEVHLAVVRIDGTERVLASVRDVTERKRRETIVRTLHDATDRFQDAETREAVCEIAVDAAEAVLDLPVPAIWLTDDGTGPLQPVAAAEAAWEVPGGPGGFGPGSFEYDVYEGDELVVYDPRERWEQTPFDRAFLVPLGEHGLLGAAEPDVDSYDEVTLDAARILARHTTSALDRVERARQLRESERRFRTIAERINEIIYLADADLTEVEYANPAYADVYGRPVDELYDDARAFFRGVHPEDRDAFRTDVETMLTDIAAGEPADHYEFAYRVERPDGEVRWLEATGYPILASDEPNRYVAVAEDVTERRRREQTLETFHEATRELTVADSRDAACRQATTAADEVLGFPLVSVHLYDQASGRLEPTASTAQLQALSVDLPAFEPGSFPWQVYVDGEATTKTASTEAIYGPGVSGPDVVVPLGSHGVMLVGAPIDSFDAADVELTRILAATLEASLNHVADERALADREQQLQREQERAERLQRLNDIIRDIEQVIIDQSARTGIEAAVCERLVEVDRHDLVWIAESAVGDDALLPRTSAGDMDAYLDALSLDVGAGAGNHPVVEAYREETARAVGNVATGVVSGDWRTTALQHGIQSVVVVPIRYENTIHGVLAVESAAPDAFDEATREVLTELGRSIGYAITVTEREQALESEGTTELEFSVDDEGLFMVRAATAVDCTVAVERTVRRAGGSFSTFYAVECGDPAVLVELADAAASIQRAQIVSTAEEGGGLVEVRAPTWFGSVFTDHGAVVREATADVDGGSLVVEAPRGANVRALVEGFQERYPGTELVAQRQRERTVRSLFELQDTLEDGLTDRQWEALETAYSAGYFSWPREASGEEVAELLGVTQPTFNKHLRTAERVAFRMLLDREYPGVRD